MKMRVRGKILLSLAMLLPIVLALAPAVAASPTTLRVVFNLTGTETLVGPPPFIDEEFRVTIKIEDLLEAEAIVQWMARVSWDPAVIEFVKVTEGPWLKSFGSTMFLTKPPLADRIPEMTCILLEPGAKAFGTGDLVYIDFKVVGYTGSSMVLAIYEYDLLDAAGGHHVATIVNGSLTIRPPPPTPPQAKFIPPDCTQFRLSTANTVEITFDAGASTSGWDTLPSPGNACPIIEWSWDLDGDGVLGDKLGQVVTWTYTTVGDVAITLKVSAPDPTPPTHADYSDTDTEVHTIHILPPIVGANLDVYTNRGGTGAGINPVTGLPFPAPTAWSDAFGPQEEVTIFALVTYNLEPVEYKPVAFEIVDPAGTTRAYRTAYSDANGIATTAFRIPWEGSGAEALFGDWAIWGTVDIAENLAKDVCKFRFGYLVSIEGITITNSPLKKGQKLGVALDLTNIAFTYKEVYITMVLYDECGVPIGLSAGSITVDPEDGLTNIYDIPIPSWAFVGAGTVYANVFDKQPILGGTPMCPEGSTPFIILTTADP